MRKIIACTVFSVFVFGAFTTAQAEELRQLSQTYTINIEVDCIETAVEIVRNLPGHNLDSSAFFDSWRTGADFRRRVPAETFRDVQETLRELGDVTFESEVASHLGAQIFDTEVRITALSQEIDRLTEMMVASDTLEVLIAVNDRLTHVSWERDSLIGRRNVLLTESVGPIIHISLIELLEWVPPEPQGFWERVTAAFGRSVTNSRVGFENFIVFIASTILAFVLWTAILGAVGFGTWRVAKRKLKRMKAKPLHFEKNNEKEDNAQ